jgi:FKBP-type peptidyl-prolyl cis-trans isomerase 2
MEVWVRELGDESAAVDGNHPLAAPDMVLDIELVSIEPA